MIQNNILNVANCIKLSQLTIVRNIHVSECVNSKRNFRKFMIPNVRGTFEHNKLPKDLLEKEFDYPVCRDTLRISWPGFWFRRKFVFVKEMEPQLIVPDLENFALKPYVSYRSPQIQQSEFTAQDLFNATLADSIIERFKSGEEFRVSVSDQEIEDARIKARQTGSDYFIPKLPQSPQ